MRFVRPRQTGSLLVGALPEVQYIALYWQGLVFEGIGFGRWAWVVVSAWDDAARAI